jgi:hypothetical protein
MVRTDLIESMASAGDIDIADLKVINQKDTSYLGYDFPFRVSTPLVPEWPLGALSHVSHPLRKAVADALYRISREDTPALAGKYSSWLPPLSYWRLHAMQVAARSCRKLTFCLQRDLGWVNSANQCMKSDSLYAAIPCPAGYRKLSE